MNCSIPDLQSQIVRAVLADSALLPPVTALKEYVVAGNGLFIRAEDSRLEALISIAPATLPGLVELEPYARFRAGVPRIPAVWLDAVYHGALSHLPDEVVYQFHYAAGAPDDANTRGGWRCVRPVQQADAVSAAFDDFGQAVIDVHSHGHLDAFFSPTDDADEGGLRFYVVVGNIGSATPAIAARVGVYGHHKYIKADTVFDGLGPFRDKFGSFDAEDYLDLAHATVNGEQSQGRP